MAFASTRPLDDRDEVAVVIIGAGGHAREVADVLLALQRTYPGVVEIAGFLADDEPDPAVIEPYQAPFLGAVDRLETLASDVAYLIGIGSPAARRQIDAFATGLRREAPVVVHPSATLSVGVSLGPGSILFQGVHLTNTIRTGRHVHVNRGATVSHDCSIGSYSTLGPLSNALGGVTIGEGVFVGGGAVFNPGVTVGDGVVVGSNAAVVRDIGADAVVAGVPATPIR